MATGEAATSPRHRRDPPSSPLLTAAEPPTSSRFNVARDIILEPFSGSSSHDGKHWFALFNRFAGCHGWTDALKLVYVPFYLRGSAAIWFENFEPQFTSWTRFTQLFKHAYADDAALAVQATEELRTRAQKAGESCFEYVQHILQLCRNSDSTMSEEAQVAHILKGIAENVFCMLHVKGVTTVQQILDFCRALDRQLSTRISSMPSVARLQNTIPFPIYPTAPGPPLTSAAIGELSPDASEQRITALIEKVVARLVPAMASPPSAAAVQPFSAPFSPPPDSRARPRCSYCGRLGHLERVCFTKRRDRQQTWQDRSFTSQERRYPARQYTNSTFSRRNFQPDFSDVSSFSNAATDHRPRSPSPGYRGRSPTPRFRRRESASPDFSRQSGNRL
jgi:hypothetical protein